MYKLTVFLLCLTSSAIAQDSLVNKITPLKFGFTLGYNRSLAFAKGNTAEVTKINNGNGFQLGFLLEFKLKNNFIFSPKAETCFSNCSILYKNNNTEVTYDVLPVQTDVMLHVMKVVTKNKHIPYLLAGPNLRTKVQQNRKQLVSQNAVMDLAFDIGCGIQKSSNYCLFAPELRYSIGLLNINEKQSELKHVYFHKLSILLAIKGL